MGAAICEGGCNDLPGLQVDDHLCFLSVALLFAWPGG